MKESEIENLLTLFHEELISDKLTLHSQQEIFPGGRTDLIFEDVYGKLLVVEIKAKTINRKDIGQLIEYWPKVKEKYADKELRLMIIAPEIPYDRRAYLEQFDIEFKQISLAKLASLKAELGDDFLNKTSKTKKASSAVYKSINKIQKYQTSLSLKYREDLNYNCITWREYRENKSNRRFYYEQGEFWTIPAETAYEIMDQAHAQGLFASRYFRWPDKEIKILDSKQMGPKDKGRLFQETLTASPEDQIFHSCNDLRVIACVEPWAVEWRKVVILSTKNNIATFRSFTRDSAYNNIYKNYYFANGWFLDRAMLDADGKICLEHFKGIRDEFLSKQG